LKLPLFAVGERTAAAARAAGFADVIAGEGDAAALRDLVLESAKARKLKSRPLLYLAGEELARDLAGELAHKGFEVVTQITYRMVPAKTLPGDVVDGIAAGRIEAVLHYSRRSARAFVDAARAGGVEISALSLPQCCISAPVADIVRDAGATQVTVAASPDENALFEALKRALPARLA
jgi:uroporphyrinogen-III synthase